MFAGEDESVVFDPKANAVVVNINSGSAKRCVLSTRLEHVVPRLNWNKRIIILTDIDFVSVHDIQTCAGGNATPSHIPRKVGFVVDVNPEHNVYLALDLVGVSPMAFTATIARLGETHSILSAPGIYSQKISDEKVKEESFGYVDATPGRISRNGRYVSADGSMDCRPDAYPGVWDLKLRRKITRESGCDGLFDSEGGFNSNGD